MLSVLTRFWCFLCSFFTRQPAAQRPAPFKAPETGDASRLSPQSVLGCAEALANNLLGLPPNERKAELAVLREQNRVLYAVVLAKLSRVIDSSKSHVPAADIDAGNSGQESELAKQAAAREAASRRKRQAELDWQARYAAALNSGADCYVEPLTIDSPGLVSPKLLADKSKLVPAIWPTTSQPDFSQYVDYLVRVRAEALQTPAGQFILAKQALAEAEAKKLGFDLHDPKIYAQLPFWLKRHARRISLRETAHSVQTESSF